MWIDVLRNWLGFMCYQGCVAVPRHFVLCLCVHLVNVTELSHVGFHNRGKFCVCFRFFLFGPFTFSCEETLESPTLLASFFNFLLALFAQKSFPNVIIGYRLGRIVGWNCIGAKFTSF